MKQVIGPFTIEIKTHISMNDGRTGETTGTFAAGVLPDRDALLRLIGETVCLVGNEGRLLTPDEFFNDVVLAKRFGKQRQKFATPAEYEYDVAALASEARAAYEKSQAEKKRRAPAKRRRSDEEE